MDIMMLYASAWARNVTEARQALLEGSKQHNFLAMRTALNLAVGLAPIATQMYSHHSS
jgi:hypothetical protein